MISSTGSRDRNSSCSGMRSAPDFHCASGMLPTNVRPQLIFGTAAIFTSASTSTNSPILKTISRFPKPPSRPGIDVWDPIYAGRAGRGAFEMPGLRRGIRRRVSHSGGNDIARTGRSWTGDRRGRSPASRRSDDNNPVTAIDVVDDSGRLNSRGNLDILSDARINAPELISHQISIHPIEEELCPSLVSREVRR